MRMCLQVWRVVSPFGLYSHGREVGMSYIWFADCAVQSGSQDYSEIGDGDRHLPDCRSLLLTSVRDGFSEANSQAHIPLDTRSLLLKFPNFPKIPNFHF